MQNFQQPQPQQMSHLDSDGGSDPESDGAFDVRFRSMLAEVSEQDETVQSLLAAQELESDDLERMEQLPEHIAAQLDDAADERIEDLRRAASTPQPLDLSRYALRA